MVQEEGVVILFFRSRRRAMLCSNSTTPSQSTFTQYVYYILRLLRPPRIIADASSKDLMMQRPSPDQVYFRLYLPLPWKKSRKRLVVQGVIITECFVPLLPAPYRRGTRPMNISHFIYPTEGVWKEYMLVHRAPVQVLYVPSIITTPRRAD